MDKLRSALAAICLILSPLTAAHAVTPDEARVLVLKAADFLAHEGKERAYAAFQERNGPYWKGNLYVFVINFQGAWEVYPPKPEAIGQSLIGLTDVDGKAFVQEMVDLAQSKGEGWVDYKWKNPETNRIQPKASYLKRVGDVFVASGVFQ
jgi:signal transduction histidine kinase